MLTIIVRDASLQLFVVAESGFVRVADDVHHSDTVQPNHLLKVDKATRIAVCVFERRRVIRPVRVGFEQSAPFAALIRVCRYVQEDGISGRLEDCVGLRSTGSASPSALTGL